MRELSQEKLENIAMHITDCMVKELPMEAGFPKKYLETYLTVIERLELANKEISLEARINSQSSGAENYSYSGILPSGYNIDDRGNVYEEDYPRTK